MVFCPPTSLSTIWVCLWLSRSTLLEAIFVAHRCFCALCLLGSWVALGLSGGCLAHRCPPGRFLGVCVALWLPLELVALWLPLVLEVGSHASRSTLVAPTSPTRRSGPAPLATRSALAGCVHVLIVVQFVAGLSCALRCVVFRRFSCPVKLSFCIALCEVLHDASC